MLIIKIFFLPFLLRLIFLWRTNSILWSIYTVFTKFYTSIQSKRHENIFFLQKCVNNGKLPTVFIWRKRVNCNFWIKKKSSCKLQFNFLYFPDTDRSPLWPGVQGLRRRPLRTPGCVPGAGVLPRLLLSRRHPAPDLCKR